MKSAKRVRFWCILAALVMSSTLYTACADEKTKASTEQKAPSTYFPIKLGDRTVQLQIAALPTEQQLGLMNRRDLKPDDGMIFVFPRPQRMSFFMRNTPTPLTIGYFDSDGILREKYDMHPFDETTVSSKRDNIQFCVEMHQGWYDRNGVKPGAALDMKAVVAAMQARGLDPIEFGLRRHMPDAGE